MSFNGDISPRTLYDNNGNVISKTGNKHQLNANLVGTGQVPFDFVVSISATGAITAWPNTGYTKVTGTELSAVLTACATQIFASSNGEGAIFIQPNDLFGAGYPMTATFDGSHSVNLYGGGGLQLMTVINCTGTFSPAFDNVSLMQGIQVKKGTATITTVLNAVQQLNDVIVDGVGGTADVALAGSSFVVNCRIGKLTVAGTFNFVDNTYVTSSLTIAAAATSNYLNGAFTAVTDSSAAINFIQNSLGIGVLTPPTVVNTAVINAFGTKVMVIISIGTTVTTVTKNATAVYVSTVAVKDVVTVILDAGETITVSQTTNVSWVWFAI